MRANTPPTPDSKAELDPVVLVEAKKLIGAKRKECANCAVEIPRDSRRCPICGYEFPQPKSRLFTWVAIILIILFLIPLIRLIISFLK